MKINPPLFTEALPINRNASVISCGSILPETALLKTKHLGEAKLFKSVKNVVLQLMTEALLAKFEFENVTFEVNFISFVNTAKDSSYN